MNKHFFCLFHHPSSMSWSEMSLPLTGQSYTPVPPSSTQNPDIKRKKERTKEKNVGIVDHNSDRVSSYPVAVEYLMFVTSFRLADTFKCRTNLCRSEGHTNSVSVYVSDPSSPLSTSSSPPLPHPTLVRSTRDDFPQRHRKNMTKR